MLNSYERVFRDPCLAQTFRGLIDQGIDIYLVGGSVRDLLLGKSIHDLDFVLKNDVRRIARAVADELGAAFYMLDEDRQTARVIYSLPDNQRINLDFALMRGEFIEHDLVVRDFTINAMAIDLRNFGQIIDPKKGGQDLVDKRLRSCSDQSFVEDPIRVLRAVRQSVAMKLRIDPITLRLLHDAVPLLPTVSAERKRDELFKILEGSQITAAIRLLEQLGILRYLLPELSTTKGEDQGPTHQFDVFEHILATVNSLELLLDVMDEVYNEELGANFTMGLAVLRLGRFRERLSSHLRWNFTPDRSRRELLLLAALLHDIGKPMAKTIEPDGKVRFINHDQIGADIVGEVAKSLALSRDEIRYLDVVVRNHMRIHFLAKEKSLPLDRRTIYRYFRATGDAGIDIGLLSLADTLATFGFELSPDRWQIELDLSRELFETYYEAQREVVNPPRLVTGDDLTNGLEIPPGPVIGKILESIREAQAAGTIESKEAALAMARSMVLNIEGKHEK